MICCPILKVKPSPENRNPDHPCAGQGAQGYVSWGNCLECQHNKGSDETRLIIKCGYPDGKITELKSIPI
jgi:hypothetical protein